MADSRLFEKTLDSSPTDLTQRIAFGKAGQATKNITLSAFIVWIKDKLLTYFPLRANNLSDVASASTARTNLNVYSKSETYTQAQVAALDAAVLAKLGGLTVLLSGGVNADGASWGTFSGAYAITGVSKPDVGKYIVTHGYTGGYIVLANTVYSVGSAQTKIATIEHNVNSFTLYTGDDATPNDAPFRFVMFGY